MHKRIRKSNKSKKKRASIKTNSNIYTHDNKTIIFQVGNHRNSSRSRGSRSRAR